MGRPHRAAEGGYVYHVLNRANARMTSFEDDGDYAAFEKVLQLAVARFETRLLSYCVMPNHWHLILWPLLTAAKGRRIVWARRLVDVDAHPALARSPPVSGFG